MLFWSLARLGRILRGWRRNRAGDVGPRSGRATDVLFGSAMSDPYFQSMFAERIGGANYGKGTRSTSSRRSSGPSGRDRRLPDRRCGLRHRRERRHGAAPVRAVLKPRWTRSRTAATRTTASRPTRTRRRRSAAGVRGEAGPVTQVNHCIGTKPALAMLPACFINRRHHADDGAGLPGGGHAHAVLRGQVFTLPLLPANGFCPTWTRSRRTSAAGKLLVNQLPNSPTGGWRTRGSTAR